MVRGVHKKVHEMRQGPDLEDMGGTKLDSPSAPSMIATGQVSLTVDYYDKDSGFDPSKFIQHFRDEVRDQLRGGTTKK